MNKVIIVVHGSAGPDEKEIRENIEAYKDGMMKAVEAGYHEELAKKEKIKMEPEAYFITEHQYDKYAKERKKREQKEILE